MIVLARLALPIWLGLTSSAAAFAQEPQVVRFGDRSADTASAVVTDAAGAVFVGGSMLSTKEPVSFAVVKHVRPDAARWVARFGGSAATGYTDGEVLALDADAAGNVYAVGRIARRIDILTLAFDWLVASYDPRGRQRWTHVINGPADGADAATRVVVDPAGAVYVVGSVSQAPWLGADTRWLVAKYAAADGRLLWTRTEGGPGGGQQLPVAMALDATGQLLVLGVSRPSPGALADISLVKYRPSGARAWQRTYAVGPSSDDVPAALAVAADGSVYVTGMVSLFGDPEGEFGPLLLKFDGDGNLQFSLSHEAAGGASVVVMPDDNVVVAGTAIGAAGSSIRSTVSSFTSAGVQRWTRRLFTDDTFAEGELAAAPDGTVFYGARMFRPSGFDYLAMRFDGATGEERWRDVTPAGSIAKDAHLSKEGAFLVTGSTDSVPTDMLTVRYPPGFAGR